MIGDVASDDRGRYRALIDAAVRACREGQGQIVPHRARAGVWNSNAVDLPDELADPVEMNRFLAGLSDADRAVLAGMLEEAFVGGVHETLVILHEAGIQPFEDGYEGTPYHDFMGRLRGWSWPVE